MTPAEVRAAFERHGVPEPTSAGDWLYLSPTDPRPALLRFRSDSGGVYRVLGVAVVRTEPGLYLPLDRLLAALGVAEAADKRARAPTWTPGVDALVADALTTYRSAR